MLRWLIGRVDQCMGAFALIEIGEGLGGTGEGAAESCQVVFARQIEGEHGGGGKHAMSEVRILRPLRRRSACLPV